MIAPLLTFILLGLGILYLQNLLLFPHVHLHLLALLLFYVALRPSLAQALSLGLMLGLLQDCYATTPLGLHMAASLVLVAVARFFRRSLLIQQLGFQIIGSLAALTAHELSLQVVTLILGYQSSFPATPWSSQAVGILGTAALGPFMYFVVRTIENFLRLCGWRPGSEPLPYEPFSG